MSANNDVAGYRPREDWPTIAQLAEGYDEYTLPDSTKLAKQSVTFVFENKIVIRHDYKDAENLTWTVLEGAGVPGYEAGMSGDANYKALEVRDGIFFVDFYKKSTR